VYERFALDRARAGAASSLVWGGEVRARIGAEPQEPEGFFGEGAVGGWQAALRPRDQIVIESVAGGLLVELGYARPGWIPAGAVERAVGRSQLALARAAASVRYHARRFA
jgi:hypothetical protein